MTYTECLYTVASQSFSVALPAHDPLWERMATQYSPFANAEGGVPLFTLTVCTELPEAEHAIAVYTDPNPHPGEAKIDVYRTPGGGHVMVLTPPSTDMPKGNSLSLLHLSSDCHIARLLPRGNPADRYAALNSALMLCYLLTTVGIGSALMHASTVVNNGRSYLFLGRSGTGKSTHSALWQRHIPGTELLNDDHPILRLDTAGRAIAYGSPWSGKTPCYRNESAPVGGIVRIRRAGYNAIRRLSPIEAYASLFTSCSGMSWDKELADGKDRTLQALIAAVPCYTLECLPDEGAAVLCAGTVRKEVL